MTTQPQEIWQDFELNLNADDVLRGQGADPTVIRQRSPRLLSYAEQALIIGGALLQPRALVREVPVTAVRHERLLVEGGRLSGSVITAQLGAAASVCAVICTVGEEIENTIHNLEANNPVLAMAVDGLANAAVDELSRQICGRLADQAEAKNLKTSTPISPGSSAWPVEIGQPELFNLLNASVVEMSLNEAFLMHPRKSASFVVGIGQDMTISDPCELCNLQEVCRFRQVNASR